jgi:hypothetical protein
MQKAEAIVAGGVVQARHLFWTSSHGSQSANQPISQSANQPISQSATIPAAPFSYLMAQQGRILSRQKSGAGRLDWIPIVQVLNFELLCIRC